MHRRAHAPRCRWRSAVVRGDASALVLDLGMMRPASMTIQRLTDWLDRNSNLFASKLRGIAVAAPELAVVASCAAAELWPDYA